MECKIVFSGGVLDSVILYTPQDNLTPWHQPGLKIIDLSKVEVVASPQLTEIFKQKIVEANLVLRQEHENNPIGMFILHREVKRFPGGVEVRKSDLAPLKGGPYYTLETPDTVGIYIAGDQTDERLKAYIRGLNNRLARTSVNEKEFLGLMDFLHKSFKNWHLSLRYQTVYFGPKKVWATDGGKAVVLPNNTGLRGMYRVLGFGKSYEFKDGKPYAGAIYGGNCDPGILRVWENRPKHSPIVLGKDTAAAINKATDKDGVVKVKVTAGKCVLHHLDKHGELHMWEVETGHPDCEFGFTWKHHSHVLKSKPQIAYRQEPDGRRGWLLLGGCLLVVNFPTYNG